MKSHLHLPILILTALLLFPALSPAQQTGTILIGDLILVECQPVEAAMDARTVQKLVVLESGRIRMPGLKEEIAAAGLSPGKLADSISQALKKEKVMLDPTVKVILAKCAGATNVITVSGEVLMPGEFPYREGFTLHSAISKAGGFSEFANSKRVKVIHKDGKISVFDIRKIKPDGSNNPTLQEGDSIIIPQ